MNNLNISLATLRRFNQAAAGMTDEEILHATDSHLKCLGDVSIENGVLKIDNYIGTVTELAEEFNLPRKAVKGG